jgi:hypothetical protein
MAKIIVLSIGNRNALPKKLGVDISINPQNYDRQTEQNSVTVPIEHQKF